MAILMNQVFRRLRNVFSKSLFGDTEDDMRAAYDAAKAGMFEPRVVQEFPEVVVIETVLEVASNGAGRLGMIVARGWHSCAVHEINQDGTFSKRRPYWTKKEWLQCSPRRFARCLVIASKTLVNPMQPPGEQVRHVGQTIVEMDTDLRPYVAFEEWKLSPSDHRV